MQEFIDQTRLLVELIKQLAVLDADAASRQATELQDILNDILKQIEER